MANREGQGPRERQTREPRRCVTCTWAKHNVPGWMHCAEMNRDRRPRTGCECEVCAGKAEASR